MPDQPTAAFISYSREDSEFALRLAQDLKAAGASVWIDQLDIKPGTPWDNAIEDALLGAPQMLVVLSPTSVRSENVRDEISYALKQGKIVIPVLYMDCVVPLRLERKQHIDFRANYARGLSALLDHLRITHPNQAVLDRAAEDEAMRQAAWQARDAEARRMAELKEREREQDALQQEQTAERLAIEEAERNVREAADRKARDHAERVKREEAERLAREAAAVQAREEAVQKAREAAARQVLPTQPLRTAEPAILLWKPKLLIGIVAVLCVLIVAIVFAQHWSSYAGVKWKPLNSGTANSLKSIAGSSDGRKLFTCGPSSAFFSSSDGGVTWESHEKSSDANCASLFSTDGGSTIWGTGFSYKLVKSADGGATWSSVSLPGADDKSSQSTTGSDTFQDFFAKFFASEVEGFYSTPNGERLWAAAGSGGIFASSNGGQGFNPMPSGTTASLYAIAGTTDSRFLMAVGSSGTILVSPGPASGVRWITSESGTQSSLRSAFVAADAKLLCAVGDMGVVRVSTDSGATWTAGQSGVGSSLHGVFGTSDGKHLWAVGTSGIIIQSDNSGATWTVRRSDTKDELNGIFGTADGKQLWVVGDNGTILESKSGFY